jgi:FkbM family methyltransferase
MNRLELSAVDHFLERYSGPTNSQLKQDVLVLLLTHFKQNGYFVEFGGCDGIYLSNTYLLEKMYKWNGILAEPTKKYHDDLAKNRSCHIDHRAVYTKSGDSIEFREVIGINEISGINETLPLDSFRKDRDRRFEIYNVDTISLEDLLKYHGAPQHIDYLSVDTEGSEFEILSNFSFENYSIDIITVEHNFLEEKRSSIRNYLLSKKYVQVFDHRSEWDDWYISKAFLESLK